MNLEKKIDVCIITEDAREKCGLERYTSLLVNALRSDPRYAISLAEPTKIGPFAISVDAISVHPKKKSSKNCILHFRSQEIASPLIFHKYPKVVVTVHDIIPLEYQLYEQAVHLRAKRFDKWFFRKTIKALERAERIITVSEATKKSLLKHMRYPKEKIHVIYEYPSKEFKEIKTIQEAKKKQKTYDVLYVGSEMPYKNITVLLHAIAEVKKKIPYVRLIKVGKALWPGAREELKALACTLGIENVIVWKDEVEKIEEEYNQAAVLIQPSLHEGFGFPVVEAMACGCPVICSNRTSLPELGGDAVLYFDPTNPYELAEKIVGILENKKMQEELQKKGLKQVKKFTKERFDKETKQVYELVKNKQTVAGLWDEAAKNPETEKVRGPYLTEIFLIPIMKAIKKIEAVQGKKTKRILKVDLWNEGIDFERNILKHIKTAENRLYGIDVSHHVCASAKKATENINIANASITKLPFKDHHFEILADLSTLDHLPKEKVEEIMKEYNRVMANNGYFVLIFDWWGIIWKIYMFYLEKVRGHGDYFFKNKGMQSRYIHPIGFIKKILRRNDFSIEEEYCIDYTGWTWNRVTKPVWDKYGSKIHDKMLGIEYSRLSKYLRPFAKQYVIIARKKEAV